MAVDLSKHPLLALMEDVNRWGRSTQSEHFWRAIGDHLLWAGQLRDEAKGIIVWLELKGLEEEASRLDEAMSNFREAVWEFEDLCRDTYPPDDFRCRQRRGQLIEDASCVADVAEELDDEVPATAWEGYGDE